MKKHGVSLGFVGVFFFIRFLVCCFVKTNFLSVCLDLLKIVTFCICDHTRPLVEMMAHEEGKS